MNESEFLQEKVKDWFAKADNDLRSAQILINDPNPPTDTICFHCQQTEEKYLKGFLTLNKIDFMKTHDLNYLLELCINFDKDFNKHEEDILSLNKYSIEPRYPADIPIYYSKEEALQAISKAKKIVSFIKSKVKL